MKIEIHLLQNFAPSTLNRDDTNTPKTCFFGEVPRARLSSQCFKRAIRDYFHDNTLVEIGLRTKRLKKELTKRLTSDILDEEALSGILNEFLESFYSGLDTKRPDETKVLLYIGEAEIQEAARCVLEKQEDLAAKSRERTAWTEKHKDDPDKKKQTDKEPALWKSNEVEKRLMAARLSADIALFGRMLAENPERNVDASCQVAHALSTHSVTLETDFYTAVDDLNTRDETGAGMLGVTGYSSACFYRYALIDRDQLIHNLNGDARLADEAIAAFLEAFVQAIPSGKQNSMAAQNRPSLGLFIVREKGVPCSLANAFASPVRVGSGAEGLIETSKNALADYFERMNRVYDLYEDANCSLFHDGIEAPNQLSCYDRGSLHSAMVQTMEAIHGVHEE